MYCQKILAVWISNNMGPLTLHPTGSVTPYYTTGALVPTPPLLSSSRTPGTNGCGEKRRTKPQLRTHADEHSMEILLWCWCNETQTENLPSCSSGGSLLWGCDETWKSGGHAPSLLPSQSRDAINRGHKPGPDHPCHSSVSDLFIARLQLFRIVTGSVARQTECLH